MPRFKLERRHLTGYAFATMAADQIWFGVVRDFILIESVGIAYNVADAFQWLGMIAGIALLWKHHSERWLDENEKDATAPQPRLNDDFGPYRGLVEKMKRSRHMRHRLRR